MYLILEEGETINTDRFEKLKIFKELDDDGYVHHEVILCNKMVYPETVESYEGVKGVLAKTVVFWSYDSKEVERIYNIIQYHMIMGDLAYIRVKDLKNMELKLLGK